MHSLQPTFLLAKVQSNTPAPSCQVCKCAQSLYALNEEKTCAAEAAKLALNKAFIRESITGAMWVNAWILSIGTLGSNPERGKPARADRDLSSHYTIIMLISLPTRPEITKNHFFPPLFKSRA